MTSCQENLNGLQLAALIRRMGIGEGAALAVFLDSTMAQRVRRVLELQLGGAIDVEDAMQEGAWKLWCAAREHPPQPDASPSAWVYRIFVNAARDLGRKCRRRLDAEWTATAVEGRDEACRDVGPVEVDARDTARALRAIAERRLNPLECAVARADLDAGGRGDDARLADLLETSRCHVRVLRSRIHRKLQRDERVRYLLSLLGLEASVPIGGAAVLS